MAPDSLHYHVGWSRIRYGTNWLIAAGATIVFGSAGVIASLVDRSGAGAHWCARRWAATVLRGSHVRVDVSGAERLERDRGYVFVANHHSLLDIPALLFAIPVRFRMLAKASLFSIPFLGWYMRAAGYVSVDRADPASARRSLREAAERLRAGHSLLVFAEGTRSPEGRLAIFKRGSFHLARSSGAQLVPVAIVNSGRLLPRGVRWVEPGTIRVRVGEPIAPDADPDGAPTGRPGGSAAALADRVRTAIARLLDPEGARPDMLDPR